MHKECLLLGLLQCEEDFPEFIFVLKLFSFSVTSIKDRKFCFLNTKCIYPQNIIFLVAYSGPHDSAYDMDTVWQTQ